MYADATLASDASRPYASLVGSFRQISGTQKEPVRTENLNPSVAVMKSAQEGV